MIWGSEKIGLEKMNAVERLGSFITRGVYTVSGPFHPFGGAVDIIVVQQQDGSFKSSPWYVKFGKFQGVLKTKEKIVNVSVNGVEAGFHMYLNHKGEAYFLKEVDGGEENSDFLSPSSSNKAGKQSQNGRMMKAESIKDKQSQHGRMLKAESLNLGDTQLNRVTHVNMSNEKITAKTNSRRSRIFRLMFGQKSMKDDNRLRKGGVSMERISSLERAEIAADLLEMKWSTNLPANNWKIKGASKRSAPETTFEEVVKDVEVSGIHAPEVVTRDSDEIWSLKSHEKVIVQPTSEASDSADSHEIISEPSTLEINEAGEKDAGFDVMAKQISFQASSLDLEDAPSVHSIDLTHPHTEQVCDKSDFPINDYGFREKCEERRASPNIYCGTPRRSDVGVDVYGGVVETRDLSSSGCKEVEFSSEVSHESSVLISKDNSKPESGVPMSRENLNESNCGDLGLSRREDSCCHDSNASYASKAVSENSLVKSVDGASSMDDVGQTITESHPSIDIYLPSSSSVEVETAEVAQDAIVERFSPERALEKVATFENQSQIISPTCLICGNEIIYEKACSELTYFVQMDEKDRACDSIEELRSCCTFTHFDSINQVQEAENPTEGVKTCELHLSSKVIIGPQKDTMISSPVELVNSSMQSSDCLEDDQFPINDIDNLALFSADEEVRMDNIPTEDFEEEHGSNDMHHETSVSSSQSFGSRSLSTTSSEEFVEESSPNPVQVLLEEIRAQSSPICISRGRMDLGDVIQSVGSFPNIRSHIHDLGWSDVQQPLRRSLDISSGSLNWDILGDDFSSTSKRKATFQSSLIQDNSTTDATAAAVCALSSMEHEGKSTSPAVGKRYASLLLVHGSLKFTADFFIFFLNLSLNFILVHSMACFLFLGII